MSVPVAPRIIPFGLRRSGTDGRSPASLRVETGPETTVETVSAGNSASRLASAQISTPRLTQTPSFVRRLPRFVRAKRSHRPSFALQDRDLDLLRSAHDYRLITTPQYLR